MAAPILIACVGNEHVCGDDLGPRVAQCLEIMALPHMQVVNLGIAPCGLIDLISGCKALIIVDALINAPGYPGALIDLAWSSDIALAISQSQYSTHGMSVADQLMLAKRLGLLPRVVRIVGWRVDRDASDRGIDETAVNHVVARVMQHGRHLEACAAMLQTTTSPGD